MADVDSSFLPSPSADHRHIAVAQFERANQVISKGDYDYGIRLLLSCCKLDPGNLIYRQALRRTEKTKYKNNLRGARLASMSNMTTKAKVKSAKRGRDYAKVLELGEVVLSRNPWDVSTQMDMAEAADALGMLDLAVWTLEQARQKDPNDTTLNRALARLYEKRGNFTQAIGLWEFVRRAIPTDVEAQHKAKDLAANETILRGNYEDVVGASAASAADTEEEAGEEAPTSDGRTAAHPAEVSFADQRLLREIAPLKARIEQSPTQVSAYLQLAQIYRRADRFEQAREVLQEGLGPTGNSFELMIELTDLEIEPFRRNLNMADDKLKTAPADDELRRIRIRLLKEINTRELDLFRQKSDRFPTDMSYRFELGVRLLRGGQIDEAIRELQATRNDPRNHWRSLLYLGYCFKQRNNWRLAQRNFEEALAALPPAEDAPRKEILFQLAQGCAEAGELQKAIDLGSDLANLDFGFRDIGKLLDEWQERLQQADV
jgi:tetratricopeptide (TPR) repeat protein